MQAVKGLASASRGVTIDEHGDEQMVPAVEQGPPTKKVAMPGSRSPVGCLIWTTLGDSTASSTPSPRGGNSVKAPHNIIRAKDVTLMRKKAKEYEEK